MQGIAVQVDGVGAAGETGDIGISGQDPFGAVLDLHVDAARRTVAVDGTGEGGILRQVEVQLGDLVDDHIAVDLLVRRCQTDVSAVRTLTAPAGRLRAQEDPVRVIVDDLRIPEVDRGRRVVDKEDVAVLVGQAASVHGEGGGAFRRVAGHGLVDHDCLIVVGLVTVLGIVVRRQVHVVEGHGVFALHDDALGGGGFHLRVIDRDVGRGIDDRRPRSGGCIGSACDGDRTAAAVGPDRRRGVTAGLNGQILCIHRPPAGRHQAAGTVAACGDIGIRDIDRRALSVAEDAVGVCSVGLNDHVRQIQCPAVGREDRRVVPVEIRLVAGIGVAGLGHGRIGIGQLLPVRRDGMGAVLRIFDRLADRDGILRRAGRHLCACRGSIHSFRTVCCCPGCRAAVCRACSSCTCAAGAVSGTLILPIRLCS